MLLQITSPERLQQEDCFSRTREIMYFITVLKRIYEIIKTLRKQDFANTLNCVQIKKNTIKEFKQRCVLIVAHILTC